MCNMSEQNDGIEASRKGFFRIHPVSLREIIATPLIFRENLLESEGLPCPSAAHLRDLAAFAGYSYGALRTALSRAVSAGEMLSFRDEGGTTRYRMTPLHRGVSLTVRGQVKGGRGLTLAILPGGSGKGGERRAYREILPWYGFRQMEPGVWIRGRVDTDPLEENLADAGMMEGVILVNTDPEGVPLRLKERLLEVFSVESYVKEGRRLLEDMRRFIAGADDPGEFARRYFCLGPLYHDFSFTRGIPLPEELLPREFPGEEMDRIMGELLADRRKDLVDYYLSLEKEGMQDD